MQWRGEVYFRLSVLGSTHRNIGSKYGNVESRCDDDTTNGLDTYRTDRSEDVEVENKKRVLYKPYTDRVETLADERNLPWESKVSKGGGVKIIRIDGSYAYMRNWLIVQIQVGSPGNIPFMQAIDFADSS